ncbi:hypothetical protein ABE65_018980 [Fictibacillus phosphorivorans]|uniref:O-antigen ligase-related domain-containing protein n=2 Tax=Fictibacillus phosphorivorans TaxID=1221500 RepID=A0A160IR93_9BACL|nr:hypothetical protein ABE65_018980 [Fictibacillus phosphorivorans]
MAKSIIGFSSKYFFEISIFLCFFLPPLGILLVLINGCYHLHITLKEGRRVQITPGLFLLGSLFLSTIGSALFNKEYSYFLISALLLSYMGLYVKMKNNNVQKTLSSIKWITIWGGLYFYALYPVQKMFMKNMYVSYLTGTALIGQTEIQQDYERLMGASYNPNLSVALLLFGLSFLLGECLKSIKSASYKKLALQVTVVGMLVHAIFLTGSKAGFGILIIIFTLFIFRWNRLYALFLTSIMLINIHFILELMPRKARLFASADMRKVIWERSIHLWQEHSLFGITPIGFHREYMNLYHDNIPHAHNMVIGIFTEYGSLGGVALLIVISIHVYKMLSLYLSNVASKKHLDTFLLSLPIILLTGVFDYVLYSPQVALIAIILLATWEKYTARLNLVHPRILSFVRKWNVDLTVKHGKKKEYL